MVFTTTTAAFLSALALAMWLLGFVFRHYGVAVIGAIILVGVGVTIATGGLMVQTGETIVTTGDTEEVVYDYEQYEPPSNLPLGILVMLGGGVMTLRALNEGGRAA